MRGAKHKKNRRKKMTTEIKTPTVEIPAEIISDNHRKAYAMAYVAGFNGRTLKFVAPVVRNSIVRGYLTGERDRKAALAITEAALTVAGIQ